MARQKLVIIDDFYEDPLSVRELALSLEYRSKPKATYPGVEAIAPGVDWEPVRSLLRSYVHEPVDGPCPKKQPFPQGKFRIALGKDEDRRVDGVHVDLQPWSAIVYLSRDEDCRGHGAVGLYRHKATGALEASPEWEAETFKHLKGASEDDYWNEYWAYMRDKDNWEEVQRVEMVFNRALLLNAHFFHASIGVFGSRPENGRLTQHFEYYYDESVKTGMTLVET